MLDFIIVDRKKPIFLIKNFIYVALCVFSPYFYTWFCIYGIVDRDSIEFKVMICLEPFFFINIIFNGR